MSSRARFAPDRPRRRGSPRPPSSPRAAAPRPSRRAPRSGSSGRAGPASRSASRPRPRTSGTCPGGSPASRCRSTSPAVIWPYIVSPSASSRRNSSQVAQRGTSSEFAIRTRGANGCVRKTADRLAGLDEQRLVVAEPEQRADDRLQRLVRARRAAGAAVDDEVLGPLRDLGIEVVEQHPQRRLGRPRARVQLGPARRAHRARGRRTATRRAASTVGRDRHRRRSARQALAEAEPAPGGRGDEERDRDDRGRERGRSAGEQREQRARRRRAPP